MAGSAIATFMLRKDIQTSLRVKATPSMKLFDVDGQTELLSLSLGDFTWESTKNFPGGTTATPTEFYFANNTDQVDLYLGLAFENAPTGLVFKWFVKRGDEASFTEMSAGVIYWTPILSPALHPSETDKQYLNFYIQVYCGRPAFGDYNPVVHINAYDSPSG